MVTKLLLGLVLGNPNPLGISGLGISGSVFCISPGIGSDLGIGVGLLDGPLDPPELGLGSDSPPTVTFSFELRGTSIRCSCRISPGIGSDLGVGVATPSLFTLKSGNSNPFVLTSGFASVLTSFGSSKGSSSSKFSCLSNSGLGPLGALNFFHNLYAP